MDNINKLGQQNIERELMIEMEKEKKPRNVHNTKVDRIPKYKKKMIYKIWAVGKEKCQTIKLLCNEKYCATIAKVVGHCFLQKKEYPRFCWESHAF